MSFKSKRAPIHGGGNLRSFEHFTGTRVKVLEGTGEKDDPFYVATAWFDENGDLIRLTTRHDADVASIFGEQQLKEGSR